MSEPDPSPARPEVPADLDALGALPERREATQLRQPTWYAPSRSAPPPDAPPPTPLEPITQDHERVWALDGLRGLAILGILPANLPSFAYPHGMHDAVGYAGGTPADWTAHFLLGTLVDVKFITLFAFLFGVGIALQTARAERSQALLEFRPYFAWRLALLGGIGLCHAIGLWYGDILFTYAGCGMAVFALRSFVKIPAVWGALGVLGLLATSGMFGLLGLATLNQPSSEPPTRDALVSWVDGPEGGPTHGADRWGQDPYGEAWIYRHGSYAQQVTWRSNFWPGLMLAVVFLYAWRLLGLMALGVAAHELGWIHAPPKLVLRVGVFLGLGLGLPLEAGFAFLRVQASTVGQEQLLDACHYSSVVVLAAGYAAVCFSISEARWKRWPLRGLANVGRMALTVYLAETLICTTLFYSWGLGRFGEPSRVDLWGVAAAVWALLILGASLWLRWFRMGPVEWAWRSLATAEAQPLRRRRVHAVSLPPAEGALDPPSPSQEPS